MPKQQENEWFVPLKDGHAYIYHGHDDPNDHSQCGPQIFCCPNAAGVLLEVYPNTELASAVWKFMEDTQLLAWAAPKVFYFYFCDADDQGTIYFTGVNRSDLQEVLRKQISLHEWEEGAARISLKPA